MPDLPAVLEIARQAAWPAVGVLSAGLAIWLIAELRALRQATQRGAFALDRIAEPDQAAAGPAGLLDDQAALRAAAAVVLALRRERGEASDTSAEALKAELSQLVAEWQEIDSQLTRVLDAVDPGHPEGAAARGGQHARSGSTSNDTSR